ncbi:hypothetical protein PR003_g24048 [Phytophthora rubi]|uniref:Uncharacterized protein n=1 Tax=Phytophthora rubi TaxID=129364 RepID=A0A6A4D002_9STRA|nr:hypothetical protein PR001_g22849 [Phytophthora rubi]KAE9295322.1 hypothetical protein PR003_g24048 [Phytophthora rubi]
MGFLSSVAGRAQTCWFTAASSAAGAAWSQQSLSSRMVGMQHPSRSRRVMRLVPDYRKSDQLAHCDPACACATAGSGVIATRR